MGKVYDQIDKKLGDWIYEQQMFFVSTAPCRDEGLIHCYRLDGLSGVAVDEGTL